MPSQMCRSSEKIDSVESRDKDPEDYFFLESIQAVGEVKYRKQQSERVKNETEYATVAVNDTDVKFKLDTGADVNVLTVYVFKSIASKSKILLRKLVVNLTAYNGKPVPVKPVCSLQCKYREVLFELEFYISETPSEPVLSVEACKQLNLVKFTQEVKSERANERFLIHNYGSGRLNPPTFGGSAVLSQDTSQKKLVILSVLICILCHIFSHIVHQHSLPCSCRRYSPSGGLCLFIHWS